MRHCPICPEQRRLQAEEPAELQRPGPLRAHRRRRLCLVRPGAAECHLKRQGAALAHKGPQQANVATAHKIARIVYHLLKTGEACVEQSAGSMKEQRRERELRRLAQHASKLGYTLTLTPATAPLPAQ
jgi:hypothetical protein